MLDIPQQKQFERTFISTYVKAIHDNKHFCLLPYLLISPQRTCCVENLKLSEHDKLSWSFCLSFKKHL